MRFKDKVALVTGGAQGIGRAIVLRLSSEGAKVAFFDLLEEEGGKVVEEIKSSGGEAMFVKADITDSGQVSKAVKAVEEKFGRIDILVNNAGWDIPCLFVKSEEAYRDKVMAINLKGPMLVTRAVLDGMIERQYGKIVSISSDAGRVGQTGQTTYSACKAAIIGFSKTLAREMVRYKINVNCVAPGPTNTNVLQKAAEANPKLIEGLARAVPWGRIAEPEEIAAGVAFLASDDAGYITGQTLSVNGGLTMV